MVLKRRSIAAFVFVATCVARPSAAHAECLVEQNDVGLGFVLPSEGCDVTVHSDVALSAVTENWRDFGLHGDVELGALAAISGAHALHLGGVIALGGDAIEDAAHVEHSVFEGKFLLRGRAWLPPYDDSLVYVDFAAGPTFIAPTSSEDPSRIGLYGEVGVNVHGGLGIFFGAEPTISVTGAVLRPRYTLGAKTTAAGFLVALSIYLCVETRC